VSNRLGKMAQTVAQWGDFCIIEPPLNGILYAKMVSYLACQFEEGFAANDGYAI